MHRLTRLLILGSFAMTWLGCAEAPETAAGTSAPLYVDQTTGHGPVPCSGDTPDHGYLDQWHPDGSCTRVRGDFIGDSTAPHPGYIFTPSSDVRNVYIGPNYTSGYVCAHPATGPVYSPCLGQSPAPVPLNHGLTTYTFSAAAIVLGYLPFCPPTPGMTTLHQCTGVYTPEDGSGYATAVVTDGIPAHALNLPNPPINAGDCYIDLSSYSAALAAQFVAPPGYTHGKRIAAVYTCP